jgi:hypothetical protein
MNVMGIHSSYVCDDHGFADGGALRPIQSSLPRRPTQRLEAQGSFI